MLEHIEFLSLFTTISAMFWSLREDLRVLFAVRHPMRLSPLRATGERERPIGSTLDGRWRRSSRQIRSLASRLIKKVTCKVGEANGRPLAC